MTQNLPTRTGCRLSFLLLLIFPIPFIPNPTATADTSPSFPQFLISAVRTAKPPDFCGESVPMNHPEVKERFEKELLLTLGDPSQVILWLKRTRRYFSVIEQMLKSAGLPDDLKYLAIAESALKPHAGSSKGAMGFWQFIPSTGRRYGLTIDIRKDERRNIFRATEAAIQYFRDLHQEFRSWTLAAAAYNMGENGLMAEILEQQTTDYYLLYLPLETQAYVFRIIAIKLISTRPELFGFDVEPGDSYAPMVYDRVRIDCAREIPIRLVAQAARTQFKVIKDLNPEIRGYFLPQGRHDILVPDGGANGFQERFSKLVKQDASGKNSRIYIVQKGDTLASIAAKFEVSLLSLLLWNRLDPKQTIHPGDRLTIQSPK